jgi:protein tyrosine phosphatase (PTP) superfamily phosphohydrolase (DUF442 family)
MKSFGSVLGLAAVLAIFGLPVISARVGARGGAEGQSVTAPTASAPAQKLFLSGVDNFGRVNEHLYRGAQPERSAYAELKSMGIDTVVKLNGEDAAAEKRLVESYGMRFVSLPWNGEGLPSHEQVVAFLALLHDHPEYHVFVHCRVGADRTGVMVALYRMEFDHWTTAQAVSEMFEFHYHHMFLPHLARYVEAFPAAMAADASLRFTEPQITEPPIAVLVH